MFNDLDEAFAALKERTPQPRFAPASAVRRRGQRRTHRQVTVAAAAVVGVVAGAGALAVVHDPGGRAEPAVSAPTSPGVSTSSPAPSKERGRTEHLDSEALRAQYPDSKFLQPDDLPAFTYRVIGGAQGLTWPVILKCSALSADDSGYTSLRLAEPGRLFKYATEAPNVTNLGADNPYAIQIVTHFRQDGATKMFGDVDAFHGCRPDQGDREVARDFGGDQSRLLRIPGDRPRYLIFVRVGSLVTEVDLNGVTDDAGARALAMKAADRLAS